METTLALAVAFGLGLLHSFDVDHLCAVASFTSHSPRARQAAGLGARWALGHTAAVMLLGGSLALLKGVVPDWFNQLAELAVGAALLAVGIWLIRETMRARELHLHWHEHDGHPHFHIHSHAASHSHRHAHRLTALGMLHGLAGTSAVMVLIPVGMAHSPPAALLYLAVFGLGTVCSMAVFAACAGRVFGVFDRWRRVAQYLRGGLGVASCLVGLVWIAHNLPPFWN